MHGRSLALSVSAVLAFGCAGGASSGGPRFVYQDGEVGGGGVPENTSRWPDYYRDRAEQLMAGHFPEGYEVVRAEEVVEGSRTLTVGRTASAEVEPMAPTRLVQLGKLGRTSTSKQSDTLKIK